MGLVHYLIVAVLVVAACVVFMIAMKAMKVEVPPWVVQIFWVLVIAVVAVLAIKFILSQV